LHGLDLVSVFTISKSTGRANASIYFMLLIFIGISFYGGVIVVNATVIFLVFVINSTMTLCC